MRITRLQIETLRLVADGKVTYVRFGNGAWHVRGANPNTVIGQLEHKLRLITRGKIIIAAKDYYRFELTDAGRNALKTV